ncbi:hypothetical protein TNCV_4396801 [Trichonephila clavipes]|uniref:Uncharacterized protein n=1 Tax=Trichonephila clavipes TaxID=2585209 RepID=A0A8X6W520_TRICX|nr:hypothetical protein TNCV_4396801 [Trichonephila clavipes]
MDSLTDRLPEHSNRLSLQMTFTLTVTYQSSLLRAFQCRLNAIFVRSTLASIALHLSSTIVVATSVAAKPKTSSESNKQSRLRSHGRKFKHL